MRFMEKGFRGYFEVTVEGITVWIKPSNLHRYLPEGHVFKSVLKVYARAKWRAHNRFWQTVKNRRKGLTHRRSK